MSLKSLMDYTFVSKYARWIPDKKRRETWNEAVDRVKEMMLQKYVYGDLENNKEIEKEIEWAYEQMRKKRVLGSQRALQFGGEPIFKHNARMYNCLHIDTNFITSEGVRSFNDCIDGEKISVLTHTGSWKDATVKSYGEQELNEITFIKGKSTFRVKATENHRWLLKNGDITDNLNVDDNILKPVNTFGEFDYDNATPDERIYWCYGFVYGDGTRVKNNDGDLSYSMVRLCGNDNKFKHRFEELGFKTSSPHSCDGDFIAYTGSYQKTAPDPEKDSPEMIRAFVAGYLSADGTKNKNKNGSQYINIQSSDRDHVEFIRKCFPVAGVWIISEKELTGQETNFGTRPYTINFRISDSCGSKYNAGWKVLKIEKNVTKETVWCLEVEDDKSFILPNGIVTGNCIVSFCDRIRFFQECMYLLLCGCGTGFSVQKHHIEKLPELLPGKVGSKKYVIPDTIEGWSDSVGVLVSSYFDQFLEEEIFPEYTGKNINFDYSEIREAGSYLKSSGGKSPGPEPLKKALGGIRKILDKAVKNGQKKLTPIQAYDIVMHTADAVISGGVRRSATICVFSPDDKEMATAKTGTWFIDNPQRGRSNNSALLLRDETSKEEFSELMKSVKEFGEPGFVWSDSTELLVNPCFHKDTRIATKDGLVGIESLYKSGQLNEVVADNRAGAGDELNLENTGVSLLPASRVKLTQKNADIYEVRTKHGHSVKVTLNHEFPTTRGRLQLKDMIEGDEILLQSEEGSWGDRGSYSQGLILGMITGDGTFSTKEKNNKPFNEAFIDVWEDDFDQLELIQNVVNDEIMELPSLSNGGRKYGCLEWVNQTTNETTDKNRIGGSRLYRFLVEVLGIENPRSIKNKLPECVWQGSREFVQGYLQGLFFADGSTQMSGHRTKATLSYRLNQSNEKLLQEVQNILSNFGIVSNIYLRREEGHRLLPDGSGGEKDYFCKANYDLIMNRPNAIVFDEKVNWIGRKKDICESFWEIRGKDCRKPERFKTKIESIEYDSTDDVFCLKQPKTNTVIANGCVVGQCVEIGMWPVCEETKESGWQACNLSTINCAKIKTEQDFFDACRAASVIGTLQAGFSEFSYLDKASQRIIAREALLGVSMTGIMEQYSICLDETSQKKGADIVKKTNKKIADLININQAARTTCIKPEGTSSCILGTSSGIHPHHAKRYIRRVQANKMEPIYNYFKEKNPRACEESVWSNNNSDDVVGFCVEVPDGSKTKNKVGAIQLLDYVKSTQKNWVLSGTNKDLCTKPWLNHNVSNTINVKPEEWDEVEKYIFKNRKYFCGISLLPISGDKDYPQAPFTTVYLPSEQVAHYGDAALFVSGLIEVALNLWEDNLWAACDSLLGVGERIKGNGKKAWKERCEKFATKYFDGDVKQLTYCMKDVFNWKEWVDMNREYVDVDFTNVIEETNNVQPEQELSCSGSGGCELK